MTMKPYGTGPPPARLLAALRVAARYGGLRPAPAVAGTLARPGPVYRVGIARALVRAGYLTPVDGAFALTPAGVATALARGYPIGAFGAEDGP